MGPALRPCAREGCKYAATWHPTHCCAACVAGHGHGGRCARQESPSQMGVKPQSVPEEAKQCAEPKALAEVPVPPCSEESTSNAAEKFEVVNTEGADIYKEVDDEI